MLVWKSKMAGGGGNKKIFQYSTDPSGQVLYLRTLQGYSGRNLVDPSLQDNVLILDNLFEYILSSWMCNHFTPHHKFGNDSGRTKILELKDTRYSLQP